MAESRRGGKTRILLLGPQLDAVSGVSTHLSQLFGSGLRENFSLIHFQVGSEGRRESAPRRFMRLVFSPFRLSARILRHRPKIVHINASLDHKSFPRDATYLAVAKALRRRVLFQVHGGEMPTALYPKSAARTRLVSYVLRSADSVILLAQSELAAYSAFVPGARLRIIANAISADPAGKETEKPNTGPLRLTYVGRLVDTKGIADCLAAAKLLSDAGHDFILTIAGAGPQEHQLKQQACRLIETDKVRFLGSVHGEAKASLWRESHIFVFPTSHLEGLPYSLLEAMAAGAVPITTRMGAQPDVIEDGVHGLFVPPADPEALYDAIVSLADNRELLSSMSRRSQQRIRDQYTVDRLATEFGEVYRSLD
ncbi:MAG: glycosyltransferase family 4 protein [Actinomycetota bacterium]